MDEYVGFSRTHPQSFGRYLDEHIFGLVPFGEVYYLDADRDDAVERYTRLLKENPPDIVFLGIGENAHICVQRSVGRRFLRPRGGQEGCRSTRPAARSRFTDGCFPTLDDVPTHAYTLTIPALVSAQTLICTVPAKTKAEAVYNTATEAGRRDYPATIMRCHPDAVMYCDADSGRLLLD